MSPLQLEILLHYHTCGYDYREGDFSAPAVRAAIDDFRDACGMLKPRAADGSDHRSYELTERGQAYLDYILAVPLPVCEWRIPTNEVVG